MRGFEIPTPPVSVTHSETIIYPTPETKTTTISENIRTLKKISLCTMTIQKKTRAVIAGTSTKVNTYHKHGA